MLPDGLPAFSETSINAMVSQLKTKTNLTFCIVLPFSIYTLKLRNVKAVQFRKGCSKLFWKRNLELEEFVSGI